MQLVELVSFKFPHIVRQDVKWTMCFVPLDLRVSLNFAHISEQLFKAKISSYFSWPMLAIIVKNEKLSFQLTFI